MAEDEVRAELSPESLAKLLAMAKEAPRAIKTSVYKSLRTAAGPAADAAKAAVLAGAGAKLSQGRTWYGRKRAVNTRSYHSGLRAGIAAGVSVGVRGGVSAAVRITSSNKGLSGSQYRMNRTYDKPVFHHPVFGRGSAAQSGVEWFYGPIEKSRPQFEEGVLVAMDEASERLAGL